jgi:hypothetical protein
MGRGLWFANAAYYQVVLGLDFISSVAVCLCVYVRACVYLRACIWVYMGAYLHSCMYVFMGVCTRASMCVNMCVQSL